MNFEVGEVLTPELTLHVCWSWFHSMNGTYSVREEGVSTLSLTRSRGLWGMARQQRAGVFGRSWEVFVRSLGSRRRSLGGFGDVFGRAKGREGKGREG